MDILRNLKQPPVPVEYTWYQDFQIADKLGGEKAIRETYENAKKNWLDNPKSWGEVTCALNWRLWDLYQTDEKTALLYQTLWEEAQELGWKQGEGDKEYSRVFFQTTD